VRKRCNRRRIVPVPPRGLRPKLDRGQLRDLALSHVVNLDAIAKGQADEDILWQWVGGILTWSRVADKLQIGGIEMTFQVELAIRLVERYRRTGRILFDGLDYQQAKVGVEVMDLLAEEVDVIVATEAADWSEARIERMSAECAQRIAA
jgi:hypothetical protein